MNYQCQVNINAPLQFVVETFLDTTTWHKWQPGFIKYEPIEGKLPFPGSKGFLVFQMGDQQGKMSQQVIENNLPDRYVVNYEFQGTWNQCVFQFKENNGQVTYTIDSLFRFPDQAPAPLNVFIATTTQEMERFKAFVEEKVDKQQ